MPRDGNNWSVEFRILVDVDELDDVDGVWERAVDILRSGGGDITGHSIYCNDQVIEEVP